jgi:hypothetical protein
MAAVIAEAERKVPGMLAQMEPESPGMHTTNTVDVDIVLAGEVVLELDDGVETVLRTATWSYGMALATGGQPWIYPCRAGCLSGRRRQSLMSFAPRSAAISALDPW